MPELACWSVLRKCASIQVLIKCAMRWSAIQGKLLRELCVCVQMSSLIVTILPAQSGHGPEVFSMERNHDAKTVIDCMSAGHGEGLLRDSKKMHVFSDLKDILQPGQYTYTLKEAEGEKCHSISCRDV